MIYKTSFHNSPYLGVYCVATDDVALIPLSSTKNFEAIIKEVLQADVVRMSMANTSLLGVFSAACNSRIIVPGILEKNEVKKLEDVFPEVVTVGGKYTAVGNLVALNDHGTAAAKYVAEELGAEALKVGGTDFVGSAVFATNKGFLAHGDASREEIKKLEKILKVKGNAGTVNLGDPFVKTGLVGNRHGVLVGARTMSPEIMRIDEAFRE